MWQPNNHYLWCHIIKIEELNDEGTKCLNLKKWTDPNRRKQNKGTKFADLVK
jgi:hypothetical protein